MTTPRVPATAPVDGLPEPDADVPATGERDDLEHWLQDLRTDLSNDPPDWLDPTAVPPPIEEGKDPDWLDQPTKARRTLGSLAKAPEPPTADPQATDLPDSRATDLPDSRAAANQAADGQAPATRAAVTQATDGQVPATQAAQTRATETQADETRAARAQAADDQAAETRAADITDKRGTDGRIAEITDKQVVAEEAAEPAAQRPGGGRHHFNEEDPEAAAGRPHAPTTSGSAGRHRAAD